MLTLIRRILEAALVLFIVGVFALAGLSYGAPLTGFELYGVRSESMTPELAIGDLVIVEVVDPETVRVGDVITLGLGNGTTVTHRVTAITPTDEGPVYTTRGDANPGPDPVAARAEQLEGRVVGDVPLLGFLLAMLSMPSGLAALFSIGATLLTAVWLLDEIEVEDDDELDALEDLARGPDPGPAPAAS